MTGDPNKSQTGQCVLAGGKGYKVGVPACNRSGRWLHFIGVFLLALVLTPYGYWILLKVIGLIALGGLHYKNSCEFIHGNLPFWAIVAVSPISCAFHAIESWDFGCILYTKEFAGPGQVEHAWMVVSLALLGSFSICALAIVGASRLARKSRPRRETAVKAGSRAEVLSANNVTETTRRASLTEVPVAGNTTGRISRNKALVALSILTVAAGLALWVGLAWWNRHIASLCQRQQIQILKMISRGDLSSRWPSDDSGRTMWPDHLDGIPEDLLRCPHCGSMNYNPIDPEGNRILYDDPEHIVLWCRASHAGHRAVVTGDALPYVASEETIDWPHRRITVH